MILGSLLSYFGAGTPCTGGDFLGFPKWYAYLPGQTDALGACTPQIQSINDVWLIVAAVVELLLRIAALAAIAMIIYGGVQFITSQGEPDKAHQARSTITNAVIGLAIAVSAAAMVQFLAGRFS